MIIGLSGKKQSGKDTVAKIIQYLVLKSINDQWSYEEFIDTFPTSNPKPKFNEVQKITTAEISGWQIKQFGSKLKQIVCLLIGCTREQLEDNNFKEKELGEEWKQYFNDDYDLVSKQESTFSELLTPRKLLQLLGTECGRQIIHPNIWLNSLFVDYKNAPYLTQDGQDSIYINKYPNWLVTDVRFPNELKAIEDRDGVIIRIIRKNNPNMDNHESETALDLHNFKYTIDNSGTIEDLIEKVRVVLIELKII